MSMNANSASNYQSGFGNHFASEAIPGTLPEGRNSPQRVAHGLYAEQLSGTAFTAPRAENRRSWLYRMRPAASHPPFAPYDAAALLRSAPFDEVPPSPNRLRWNPLSLPQGDVDFIDGLTSYAGNGDVAAGQGCPARGLGPAPWGSRLHRDQAADLIADEADQRGVAHARQGRLTGIFYLPLTLVCYLYGFLRYPMDIHHAHDASPMELWADIWSGNEDRNLILAARRRDTHLR